MVWIPEKWRVCEWKKPDSRRLNESVPLLINILQQFAIFLEKHRSWLANIRTSTMICLQIYDVPYQLLQKRDCSPPKILPPGSLVHLQLDWEAAIQKFGRPRASRRGSWCEQSFQNLHLALDSLAGPKGWETWVGFLCCDFFHGNLRVLYPPPPPLCRTWCLMKRDDGG